METQTLQAIMVVLIAALYIPACYIIARKAGYAGWCSLLMLLPVVNLLVIYWFALSTWPADRAAQPTRTSAERLPNS